MAKEKGLIDQSSKWIKNVGDAYMKMQQEEADERNVVPSEEVQQLEEGAVLGDIKKKAKIKAKSNVETERTANEVPKPSRKRSLRPNREKRPVGAQ